MTKFIKTMTINTKDAKPLTDITTKRSLSLPPPSLASQYSNARHRRTTKKIIHQQIFTKKQRERKRHKKNRSNKGKKRKKSTINNVNKVKGNRSRLIIKEEEEEGNLKKQRQQTPKNAVALVSRPILKPPHRKSPPEIPPHALHSQRAATHTRMREKRKI